MGRFVDRNLTIRIQVMEESGVKKTSDKCRNLLGLKNGHRKITFKSPATSSSTMAVVSLLQPSLVVSKFTSESSMQNKRKNPDAAGLGNAQKRTLVSTKVEERVKAPPIVGRCNSIVKQKLRRKRAKTVCISNISFDNESNGVEKNSKLNKTNDGNERSILNKEVSTKKSGLLSQMTPIPSKNLPDVPLNSEPKSNCRNEHKKERHKLHVKLKRLKAINSASGKHDSEPKPTHSSSLPTMRSMPTMHQASAKCLAGGKMKQVLEKYAAKLNPKLVVDKLHNRGYCNFNEKGTKNNSSTNSNRESTVLLKQASMSAHVPDTPELLLDIEMVDVSVNMPSLEMLYEMQVDNSSADPESYYFVLDTNILISELKFVDEFKDIPFQGHGLPHICIPWAVIQELDKMKSDNGSSHMKVREAVRYIYTMLNTKHPRFHGQTAKAASQCEFYRECNDDSILSYCLQLQRQRSKEKVFLLTDDKNLCSKALLNDVVTYTMVSLVHDLNIRLDQYKANKNGAALEPLEQKSVACNKELDYIMQESKLLLKCFLETYLIEAMLDAFGDLGCRFLPKSPYTLIDLLDYFKKYWVSVFSCILPGTLLSDFEKLRKVFGLCGGYIQDMNQALSICTSIENICSAFLQVCSFPKCKDELTASLFRIRCLKEQIKSLQAKEPQLRTSPKGEIDKQNHNSIVLGVFNHIWDLISHLCGMIMDFTGKPHDFVYKKPEVLPAKADFQNLIPNLYPGIHKIKKAFSKALNSFSESREASIKLLYTYLVQFIPSLKIQATPPPLEQFSIAALTHFFNDPDNKTLLDNGYAQLEQYHVKLEACIHDPIWKQ